MQAACRRRAGGVQREARGERAVGGRRHPFLLWGEHDFVGLAHRLDRVAAQVGGRVLVDVGLVRVGVRVRVRGRGRGRVQVRVRVRVRVGLGLGLGLGSGLVRVGVNAPVITVIMADT